MGLLLAYGPNAKPSFSGTPTISGTLESAATLTAGGYTVSKARAHNVTVRWYRHTASDGSDPTGVQIATGTTYVLTGTDAGNYIRVIVTATNNAGVATATSAYTTAIQSAEPPTIVTAAVITSTTNPPDVGDTLTVTADFDGETSITYQWYSYATEPIGSPLAGTDEVELGTASTQALTESEAGRWIVAVVTATNAAGTAVTSDSVAMAGVDPYAPIAPQEYAYPAYDTSGMRMVYVNSGDDLQAALNNAIPGDCLVLDADATWTGHYDIPVKAESENWIYVISSRMADLPAAGERVVCGWEATRQGVADDSANMPTLRFTLYNTSENNRHGWFQTSATKRWRFCGLEFDIDIEEGQLQYTVTPVRGDDIVFDRCYLHGSPEDTRLNRDGFVLYGSGKHAIVGCHVSDFKATNGAECHAIHVFSTTGQAVIENNFISSSTIPLFIGDSVDGTNGAGLKNVVIRGNHVYKPDTYKKTHPSWNGLNYSIKNHFEIKNGSRILVEGNLFENSWDGGDQSGQWLNINAWSAAVNDVTFRNNVIYNCNDGWIASQIAAPQRIAVRNNVFYKLNGWGISGFTNRFHWLMYAKGKYISVENNTVYYPSRTSYGFHQFFYGSPAGVEYLRVRNNVLMAGLSGDISGNDANGKAAVQTHVANTNYQYQNNVVLFGQGGATYLTYPSGHEDGKWENFAMPSSTAAVGYSSTSFAAVGDFELSGASAYATYGTSGSKPGINAVAITSLLNDSFPT